MPTSSPSCTLVVIQTEAERRAEEAERLDAIASVGPKEGQK